MKKALSILLVVIILLCMLPTTVFASEQIIVSVVGIALPVPGQKPDFTAEFPNTYDNLKIYEVTWTEYDEDWEWQKDMTANDTFKKNYWYVVTVYVQTVGSGNTFASNAYGYINDNKATNYTPTDNNTKFTMYTSYQALDSNKVNIIDKVDLSVVMPVVGKTPTFAKVNTSKYETSTYGQDFIQGMTNGVIWENETTGNTLNVSNAFQADCTYSFTCLLDAKDGYLFNTKTTKAYVNGQAAKIVAMTNKGNNNTSVLQVYVEGIVPTKEISTLDLSITAPKDGEKPAYNKIDGTGYYSDNGINGSSTKIYKNGIAWYKSASSYISPGTTETFKGGTDYTVKIALTPKGGYKFKNTLTAKINGKTATVEKFDDGSINVSVALTAAKKEHTHTPSEWRTTGIYHYKACTICGDFLEQEDHKGGVATCSEKGKCTVCGYAYIEENENHEPDTSKWTACGNLYHAHLCKDCGAHAIIEDHQAGPAATETEPQKCTVCGYIIAPAKNHTHSLKKVARVDATCIKPGNVEHYTCDGCADVFADSEGKTKLTETVIAPLGHKASDDWKFDEKYHWRTCTLCNEVLTETEMAHEMENGKCTTCNHSETLTEPTEPDNSEPTGTSPTDGDPEQNDKADKDNGALVWIILGIVVVVAAGAVIIILVLKKKEK